MRFFGGASGTHSQPAWMLAGSRSSKSVSRPHSCGENDDYSSQPCRKWWPSLPAMQNGSIILHCEPWEMAAVSFPLIHNKSANPFLSSATRVLITPFHLWHASIPPAQTAIVRYIVTSTRTGWLTSVQIVCLPTLSCKTFISKIKWGVKRLLFRHHLY